MHGFGHRARLIGIGDDRVVQRPMGFDIAERCTGSPGKRLQCSDLVDHVGGEFSRRDIDPAPPEPGKIEVADLRTDPHAPRGGGPAGARQTHRVTGVEAARQIGAGDDVEHGVVVTEFPDPVSLGEVGVEIHGRHRISHRMSLSRCGVVSAAADGPARQENDERDRRDEHRNRYPRCQRQHDATDRGHLGEHHRRCDVRYR